jgi:hypothetical protein
MTTTLTFSVVRPDDLLVARIEVENMALESGDAHQAGFFRRIPGTGPCQIAMYWPTQHILESSSDPNQPAPLPRAAIAAAPSLLVFQVPDDVQEIRATLADVLEALRRCRPDANLTALRVPYGLLLLPNGTARWHHRGGLVRSDGSTQWYPHGGVVLPEERWTELWQTRLGTEQGDPMVDDSPFPELRVDDSPLDSADQPPLSQPTPDQRGGIVERAQEQDSRPLIIDQRFLLSSLGASVGLHSDWAPNAATIQFWRHETSFGRDQHVEIVEAGFLFPFGHRASMTRVTNRVLRRLPNPGGTDPARLVAALETTVTIRVTEPLRTYSPELRTSYQHGGNEMPFRSVRLLTFTAEIDLVEDPTLIQVGGKPLGFSMIAEDPVGRAVHFTLPLFFIRQGDPDRPHDVATVMARYAGPTGVRTADLAGQAVALAPPPLDGSGKPGDTTVNVNRLTFDVQSAPELLPPFLPTFATANANIPPLDRLLAGARQVGGVDVTLHPSFLAHAFDQDSNPACVLLALPAVTVDPPATRSGGMSVPRQVIDGLSARLGPLARTADLVAPPGAAIARPTFNPGQVFGQLGDDVPRLLGSIKLTDILPTAPMDVDLGRLDQLRRDVLALGDGDLQRLVAGVTDEEVLRRLGDGHKVLPTNLSGAQIRPLLEGLSSEQLVGTIATLPEAELQRRLPGLPDAVARPLRELGTLLPMPVITSRPIYAPGVDPARPSEPPRAVATRLYWRTRVGAHEPLKPVGGEDFIPLTIDVRNTVARDGSAPTGRVEGRLERFVLEFFGIVAVRFTRLTFLAETGKKTDLSAEGVGVTFMGALSFMNELQQLLPADGFSDPPNLTVGPDGVVAGYTLGVPAVGVGIFALQNLNLSAQLDLSYIAPAAFRFALSRRDSPFLVTVSLFGGGGYFALEATSGEGVTLEAAIEFGGNFTVDLVVASGGIYLMAGIYFKTGPDPNPGRAGKRVLVLSAYVRAGGYVEVLGLITVSIEFYVELEYREEGGRNLLAGVARVTIGVRVLFFSTSVTVELKQEFAGSGADPTFDEVMTTTDWEQYCRSFA